MPADHSNSQNPMADNSPPPVPFKNVPPPENRPDEWFKILFSDKPPPDIDAWYRKLRPNLHQASYYTVPTYYLDAENLSILDYNVTFELLFQEVAGSLRGQPVNWFIAKLQNSKAVFAHGIKFTAEVKKSGRFPFVDVEPIVYDSTKFGRVSFMKVASQLHDPEGRLKGWAVSLIIRSLANWDVFEQALEEKLYQDKMWSVYAGPYDRILTGFQPYVRLLEDVKAALPSGNLCVGDLGAGTGNLTVRLLGAGHQVFAVENNIGMLDRLAVKIRGNPKASLVKASVENLECFKMEILDAAVLVNVLYAVDQPLRCLHEIHRLLRPGGVLCFSTTHRKTNLDELLAAISDYVRAIDKDGQLAADYDILTRVNRDIERTIARRHTQKQYLDYVKTAGFEIIRHEPATYHNAVMLVHARKK